MPVVISSNLVLSAADDDIPFGYPRLLWRDVWSEGTITASTEEDDAPGANAADYLTYDYWQPTALPAELELELDEGAVIDYLLLAAHDLGSNACTIEYQYHDGAGWVTLVDEISPGTDKVLACLFEAVTTSRLKLIVTGAGDPPSIGIVMSGEALALQRGPTLNHKPLTMQRVSEVRPNKSEGGHTLGRSILRKGVAGVLEFESLTAAWVRDELEPFIEHARTHPFGWVWAPVDYPAEVVFGWTTEDKPDIRPEHAGLPDRMNVAFQVEGIVE